MTESQSLLKDYVNNHSESAFRELLTRYIDLVHSAAVRLVNGNCHLADDITQTVFVDFARLARTLPDKVMVGGWLYTHTCFVASTVLRSERRRQNRERQAAEMNSIDDHTSANLAQIMPVLDEAMNKLATGDRSVILLRFFEQMDFRSVSEALGTSEEAAKKRISRALEKLRDLLVARGVALSSAALATALTTEAVKAAPAGLLAAIAPVALGTGAAGSAAATVTFIKLMTTSKLAIGAVSAIIVAGVAFSAKQYQAQAKLRDENLALRQRAEQLVTDAQRLSKQITSLTTSAAAADNQLQELMRLRGEVTRLRREAIAQNSPDGTKTNTVPRAVTEADVSAFLKRTAAEQGQLLGAFRSRMMGRLGSADDFVYQRSLAEEVRPQLESLESRPSDFAAFQTAFIQNVLNMQDEARLGQIREIIHKTYEQAVATGLDSPSRPATEVEEWAIRRDELDRQATKSVQTILTPDELATFDGSFLGIMGIDLGINDGAWHRFVRDDGTIVFPSEQRHEPEPVR